MFSQSLAESGELRRLRDQSQGKLQAQRPLEVEHERDRLERIAAGFEEVVLRAANGRLKYLLPDVRHRLRDAIAVRRTGFSCSGDSGALVLDVDLIQGHERALVQLGTRQSRNLVNQIEASWPHGRRRQ